LECHFTHPRALETVVKLEQIPVDAPSFNRQEWKSIHVPTLILANRQDPIHPFEYGEVMTQNIPGAEFRELTPKSANLKRHGKTCSDSSKNFCSNIFQRNNL
jgi:pimeloyl-ACP methyl ester carboxylesterase